MLGWLECCWQKKRDACNKNNVEGGLNVVGRKEGMHGCVYHNMEFEFNKKMTRII